MFWRNKHAPIGDAPHNQPLRVRGTVEAGAATLVAPVTGRTCVWYELEVQHEIGVDLFRRRIGAAEDFAIADDSGRAAVLGAGVTVKTIGQDYVPYSRHEPKDEPLAERLIELGVLKRDRNDLIRELMIYERAILIGDVLDVRGSLTRTADVPMFEACEVRCKRDEGVTIPAALPQLD